MTFNERDYKAACIIQAHWRGKLIRSGKYKKPISFANLADAIVRGQRVERLNWAQLNEKMHGDKLAQAIRFMRGSALRHKDVEMLAVQAMSTQSDDDDVPDQEPEIRSKASLISWRQWAIEQAENRANISHP